MKIANTFLAFFCSVSPVLAWGTVMEPWYPEGSIELQARADYYFQLYNTVQSSHGDFSYHARDNFLDLSVLGAVEEYGAELELVLSDTKHHSFYPDCFKLTGRYEFMNDSVGDPVSIIAGVSAIIPTKEGLDDLSSFHHGHFEGEAHVAVGKETICYDYWTSRYSAVASVGCATDRGSPWFRANFNYEKNWERSYFLKLFVNTLWGTGRNAVRHHRFHGYGAIAHRSVDIGTKLSYLTDCGFTLALGYAYRPYAHNFPKNTNIISFDVLYPFGL